MTEGNGRFIVGGAVLVVRRNGADAPLKVTSAVISSVTRAGYAYLRGDERRRFKLKEGCAAGWERAARDPCHAPAWIVPDTPANRKLYAEAMIAARRRRSASALQATNSTLAPVQISLPE